MDDTLCLKDLRSSLLILSEAPHLQRVEMLGCSNFSLCIGETRHLELHLCPLEILMKALFPSSSVTNSDLRKLMKGSIVVIRRPGYKTFNSASSYLQRPSSCKNQNFRTRVFFTWAENSWGPPKK